MFNVKFHLHKTLRCYFSLFTLVPFPLSPLNPKFLFVIKFLTPFCIVLSTPKLLVFLSKVVVLSFSWFFGQVSYSMFLFFFFGKEVIIIIIIFFLLTCHYKLIIANSVKRLVTNIQIWHWKRRKHFKRCSFVDCRAESGEKWKCLIQVFFLVC